MLVGFSAGSAGRLSVLVGAGSAGRLSAVLVVLVGALSAGSAGRLSQCW